MEVTWIQILVVLNVIGRAFSEIYEYNGQGLTTMPNIPADAIVINLESNNIETFSDDAFEKFDQLELLVFSDNPVKEFPNLIPVGNTLLEIIGTHTNITHINETIFNELRVIEAIDFKNNMLTSFPNVPGPGNTLDFVDLEFNQLFKFPPMYHYKALHHLDLSDNPMTSLQDSDVDNLQIKLRELVMHNAPLHTLHNNPKALQNLEVIVIVGANVSTIERFHKM